MSAASIIEAVYLTEVKNRHAANKYRIKRIGDAGAKIAIVLVFAARMYIDTKV